MPVPFLGAFLIGLALNFLGYLLMPKPKQPKPPAAEDIGDPTAEAGRPVPVIFGSLTIQSPNNLGFFDKAISTRKVRVSKK
jgi:hypothetical protein